MRGYKLLLNLIKKKSNATQYQKGIVTCLHKSPYHVFKILAGSLNILYLTSISQYLDDCTHTSIPSRQLVKVLSCTLPFLPTNSLTHSIPYSLIFTSSHRLLPLLLTCFSFASLTRSFSYSLIQSFSVSPSILYYNSNVPPSLMMLT